MSRCVPSPSPCRPGPARAKRTRWPARGRRLGRRDDRQEHPRLAITARMNRHAILEDRLWTALRIVVGHAAGAARAVVEGLAELRQLALVLVVTAAHVQRH